MKLLSIVIPFYNTEKEYFSLCLNSLAEVDLDRIEIIVVDDGSDVASSQEISAVLERTGLEVQFYKKPNGGQNSARSYGLQYATGQYVFFLDSDDYVDPVALSASLVCLAVKQPHILAFNYDVLAPDGHCLRQCKQWAHGYRAMNLREGVLNFNSMWMQFFQVSALKELPFGLVQGVRIGEDLASAVSILIAVGDASTIGLSLYRYVKRPSSTLSNPPLKSLFDIQRAFDGMIERVGAKGREYYAELEWIAILHVLYWGGIRIVKCCGPDTEKKKQLFKWMDDVFPGWKRNRYMKTAEIAKKIAFKLIIAGDWRTFYLLFHLRQIFKKMMTGR